MVFYGYFSSPKNPFDEWCDTSIEFYGCRQTNETSDHITRFSGCPLGWWIKHWSEWCAAFSQLFAIQFAVVSTLDAEQIFNCTKFRWNVNKNISYIYLPMLCISDERKTTSYMRRRQNAMHWSFQGNHQKHRERTQELREWFFVVVVSSVDGIITFRVFFV